MDIIDEAIDLFRANSLFRNFEIKGPADRVSAQQLRWMDRIAGSYVPELTAMYILPWLALVSPLASTLFGPLRHSSI